MVNICAKATRTIFLKMVSAKPVVVRNVQVGMSISLAVLRGNASFASAQSATRPKTRVIVPLSTATASNVNIVMTGSAPKRFARILHYSPLVRMMAPAFVAFVVVGFVLTPKANRCVTMNFMAMCVNTAMEANARKSMMGATAMKMDTVSSVGYNFAEEIVNITFKEVLGTVSVVNASERSVWMAKLIHFGRTGVVNSVERSFAQMESNFTSLKKST